MENGEDKDIHRVCTTVLSSTAFQQIEYPSVMIFLPASNSIDFNSVSHMKKFLSDSDLNLSYYREKTGFRFGYI